MGMNTAERIEAFASEIATESSDAAIMLGADHAENVADALSYIAKLCRCIDATDRAAFAAWGDRATTTDRTSKVIRSSR